MQLTGEIFPYNHTLLPYFKPKPIYGIYLNDNHKVTNKPAVCKQDLPTHKQHLEERTEPFWYPNKNPPSFSSEKAASPDCSITSVPLRMQNLLNLEKNNDSEAKDKVEILDFQLWHCFTS